MKSAVFERQQQHLEQALSTTNQALAKFPSFAKLHMIKGQILTDMNDIPSARAAYAAGVKACSKNTTLWILASRLEEKDGRAIKARALLEKARLVIPKQEDLWAEAVGIEERSGGTAQAKALLARGMESRYLRTIIYANDLFRQVCRIALCPAVYGLWLSGWNPDRHAKPVPLMR